MHQSQSLFNWDLIRLSLSKYLNKLIIEMSLRSISNLSEIHPSNSGSKDNN